MADKYSVVTTFSQRGHEAYGRAFIDTFDLFWPKDITLHVYYEGEKPSDASKRAVWHPLDKIQDRIWFMERYKDDPRDYRLSPVRFSHKVFALTSAPRYAQHLMFLDADCETIAKVTEDHLQAICAEDNQIGSYLGRPHWRHSETGFTSYNLANNGGDVLNEFRKIYTSGEVVSLQEQHDSMAYDVARKGFERKGFRFKNICAGSVRMNVFPESPFRDIVVHHKGIARKDQRYGDHMIEGVSAPLSQIQLVPIPNV